MSLSDRPKPPSQLCRYKLPSQSPVLPVSGRDPWRRRALLVGLEYRPSHDDVGELHFIHRDIENFKKYLVNHAHFPPENVTVMRDDSDDPLLIPTRNNIFMQISRLVKGASPGDYLVFLYAGHGAQTLCKSGTEKDGFDEAIIASNHAGWPTENAKHLPTERACNLPRDHKHRKKYEGIIIDNELREQLVNPLPAGVQLLAFFETCHSGTILDLDSKRWKRKCVKTLRALPNAVDQLYKHIRRPNVAGLSTMDFIANPLDSCSATSQKIASVIAPPKRGNSYDYKCFLKSLRDYEHGDPSVISFCSTRDKQQSFGDEWTMIRVIIEFLEGRRQERDHHFTALDLREYVKKRLTNLRLALLEEKGIVDLTNREEYQRILPITLTPQVSTLDKKMLYRDLGL